MTHKTQELIVHGALALPDDVKAWLAEQLLASVESSEQREVDAAWEAEIAARIHADEAGQLQSIPASEVYDSILSKFK